MGKEEILKKLAAELEGKSSAWSSGFKLGIVHLGKLFEEDSEVLKDNQQTKQYLDDKIEKLCDKLTHQRTVEIKDIQKGFNATYSFAERFRAQKDWKKDDKTALYDAILELFAIPIPSERHK